MREDCIPGTDGQINVCVKCYTCYKPGNIARFCPTLGVRSSMQVHHSLLQGRGIPRTWVLLDMCPGANCTNNANLLTNVRWCKTGEDLTVVTNRGSKYFKQASTLVNVPGVQITMNMEQERAITVWYKGKKFNFKECSEGLYYYNTAQGNSGEQIDDNQGASHCLVLTMKDNKTFFMKDEIKRVEEACCIQQQIC
eukprot:13770038-Ditylum_brightwellii.AAC.1